MDHNDSHSGPDRRTPTVWVVQDEPVSARTWSPGAEDQRPELYGISILRDAAMKRLNDALAQVDAAERGIDELNPKELRDAIQGYASSLRELIEALSRFDRPRSSTGLKKPILVLVRQPLH
jgi:hypothetical protein